MLKLIKFGAIWCGPCRAMLPILEELKNIYTIEEYDVDEIDAEILSKYKVRSVPTLVLEIDDKEVWRHVGSISKSELENKLKEYV